MNATAEISKTAKTDNLKPCAVCGVLTRWTTCSTECNGLHGEYIRRTRGMGRYLATALTSDGTVPPDVQAKAFECLIQALDQSTDWRQRQRRAGW